MCSNDPEGKIYFSNYLKSKGFNIVDLGTEYSRYDIKATYNGNTYYFELKKRTVSSTDWNDSIIEKNKYDALDKLDGKVYIVNLFTDCFHIFPLHSPHEEQNRYARKTTNWDRTKINKIFISYPNSDKSRREYTN